ncbi:unnamed protein product [Thlaspi arvense]|uniref:Uncharacterized protein n=1 Tax=Thlaspi arvense TaxID=13288 RepID=A0AAU9SSN8_THLAR|nr:unnamed protein product [Thlaspi arvense]
MASGKSLGIKKVRDMDFPLLILCLSSLPFSRVMDYYCRLRLLKMVWLQEIQIDWMIHGDIGPSPAPVEITEFQLKSRMRGSSA